MRSLRAHVLASIKSVCGQGLRVFEWTASSAPRTVLDVRQTRRARAHRVPRLPDGFLQVPQVPRQRLQRLSRSFGPPAPPIIWLQKQNRDQRDCRRSKREQVFTLEAHRRQGQCWRFSRTRSARDCSCWSTLLAIPRPRRITSVGWRSWPLTDDKF